MSKTINKADTGIGSYFHFEDHTLSPINRLLELKHYTFYTGRQALLYVLNQASKNNKINKIWFPNYYCQHTLHWIKKTYPTINIYEVNPFEFSQEIDVSEFANENDIVVVNNYWGLSSMPLKKNKFPLVIEDHSHGWLSEACLNSTADYCFVSLRKSLPIPLGGIFWQPNSNSKNIKLDFKEDNNFYTIWDKMLKGMKLKSSYLNGNTSIKSSTFLPLFYEVEEYLNQSTHYVHLKKEHLKFIESFINFDILHYKINNLNFLYSKLNNNPYFKIVRRDGYVAFGLHLVFKNQTDHDNLRSYLVKNNIFPSNLWPDNNIDYEWQYFLNIHIDFRYGISEMKFIIEKLNSWSLNNNS
jgi:hypothetical protein